MKLEDIIKEWESDLEIDQSNIGNESSKIPKLHNKYYVIYLKEGYRIRQMRADYKKLFEVKRDYYLCEMDPEDLKKYEWKPFQKKVLESQVNRYVESDSDIIDMTLKIGIQEEKLKYLEAILDMINKRGFQIKNIIDWIKLSNGER